MAFVDDADTIGPATTTIKISVPALLPRQEYIGKHTVHLWRICTKEETDAAQKRSGKKDCNITNSDALGPKANADAKVAQMGKPNSRAPDAAARVQNTKVVQCLWHLVA